MSIRSALLDYVLQRSVARRPPVVVADEVARRRREGQPPPAPVPARVLARFAREETRCHWRPVTTLRHPRNASGRVLVYLPGGGYAHTVTTAHWNAAADYAWAAGVDVVLPVYDVAPRGTAAQAGELVDEVVAEQVRRRGPDTVVVAGDSAGAGLALAAVLRHPERIRAAVLLSPWLDVEIGHPAARELQRWDSLLNVEELREWGRVWASGMPTDSPDVSPLNGSVDGLPPVHIVTGGRDLLMPQALDAHRLLRRAGNTGTLCYAPDANHAIGLLRGATPESRRVQAWMRDILGA